MVAMSVESEGMPDWAAEMNRRYDDAPTREAKLAVLLQYMSEDMALDALGAMLDDLEVGVVDTSQGRPVDVA
jgi:hypothetical protein